MSILNLPCVSCSNQLTEVGSLLKTSVGPFVCCEVCRTLYYVDIVDYNDKPTVVIQPTKLEPEQEYDIIRNAESITPLKDYIVEKNIEGDDDKVADERQCANSNFNLKSIIEESVTPSDLIRNLKG